MKAQRDDRIRALDDQFGRIFQAREYAVPGFGPARWLPDGTAYTTVERAHDTDAWDIVRYDVGAGARSILVAGSRLVPEGTNTAFATDDYAWSHDGQRLLVFTNTKRVWRQNTRGDYWVLDLDSRRMRRLGERCAALHADVREVLAGRVSRGVRSREQHPRRAPRRWTSDATDGRRVRYDQRNPSRTSSSSSYTQRPISGVPGFSLPRQFGCGGRTAGFDELVGGRLTARRLTGAVPDRAAESVRTSWLSSVP
jgi:hypothetical protein